MFDESRPLLSVPTGAPRHLAANGEVHDLPRLQFQERKTPGLHRTPARHGRTTKRLKKLLLLLRGLLLGSRLLRGLLLSSHDGLPPSPSDTDPRFHGSVIGFSW